MIDEATQKALNDHLEAFFKDSRCPVCHGENFILCDPVAMPGVETPLTDEIMLSGVANVYFPSSCQACGFTYFFMANAVTKKRVQIKRLGNG